MKVAISLPDQIFAAAERLAEELQVPRSRLYAEAIAQYLDRQGAAAVTARLNALYSQQVSGLAAEFAQTQSAVLADEAW